MEPDRYLRHALIDWFDQPRLQAARVAVVGAGAIGNEAVKNLALLGVGAIDVCDFDAVELHNLTRSIFLRETDVGAAKAEAVARRAAEVDPNVTVRALPGDLWQVFSVSTLQGYDCVIAAVDNFEARLRLNQLCLLAAVDLVNAAIDSRYVTVESFPFGSTPGSACYECHLPESAYARVAERYSCGGLRRRAHAERKVPTTAVTASVAGALAVSFALRLAAQPGTAARRVFCDTLAGRSQVAAVEPSQGCPACGAAAPPQVVRVRNRWSPGPAGSGLAPQADDCELRLSDALVTALRCANCGDPPGASALLHRRAADLDDSVTLCAGCGQPAISVETRDRFSVAELATRFGTAPVPAKFALAEIGGRRICFDLE